MNASTRPEHDTTSMKVDSRFSPPGNLNGEVHLASTRHMGMRMFRLSPGDGDRPHTRDYEVTGYVLRGTAQLTCDGVKRTLGQGQGYAIPAGKEHCFSITEGPFECVEATCPPSFVHDRDKRL